jgi:hypothetical protein
MPLFLVGQDLQARSDQGQPSNVPEKGNRSTSPPILVNEGLKTGGLRPPEKRLEMRISRPNISGQPRDRPAAQVAGEYVTVPMTFDVAPLKSFSNMPMHSRAK